MVDVTFIILKPNYFMQSKLNIYIFSWLLLVCSRTVILCLSRFFCIRWWHLLQAKTFIWSLTKSPCLKSRKKADISLQDPLILRETFFPENKSRKPASTFEPPPSRHHQGWAGFVKDLNISDTSITASNYISLHCTALHCIVVHIYLSILLSEQPHEIFKQIITILPLGQGYTG